MADPAIPTTEQKLAALNDALLALKTALTNSTNETQLEMQQADAELRAVLGNMITPAQAQQLIESAVIDLTPEQLQAKVIQVMNDLPDINGFSHNLGSNYQTGSSFTLNLAGATTPGGKPVLYKLSNLTNLTAAATETTGSVELTFGGNTGAASLTITPTCGEISSAPIVLSTTLFSASIQRPTINSPAQNATDVALKPLITWSGYATIPANHDTYIAAEVRVKKTDGTVVWSSGQLGAVTSTTVTENLPGETALDIEVRQKGSKLGWSDWSLLRRVTTKAEGGPGHVYPDGGIGGPVFNGYQLIVAPANKRGQSIRHGLYSTATSLTDILRASTPDPQGGYDNTNILISDYSGINDDKGSVGPEAAKFCRNLGSDWYLPNKDELKAIVDMAAQIDAADSSSGISFADIGSNWIWTSTEYGCDYSWVVRASDGHFNDGTRNHQLFVVPVRRVPV